MTAATAGVGFGTEPTAPIDVAAAVTIRGTAFWSDPLAMPGNALETERAAIVADLPELAAGVDRAARVTAIGCVTAAVAVVRIARTAGAAVG